MKAERCEHGILKTKTCSACETEFMAAFGIRQAYEFSPAPEALSLLGRLRRHLPCFYR